MSLRDCTCSSKLDALEALADARWCYHIVLDERSHLHRFGVFPFLVIRTKAIFPPFFLLIKGLRQVRDLSSTNFVWINIYR